MKGSDCERERQTESDTKCVCAYVRVCVCVGVRACVRACVQHGNQTEGQLHCYTVFVALCDICTLLTRPLCMFNIVSYNTMLKCTKHGDARRLFRGVLRAYLYGTQ